MEDLTIEEALERADAGAARMNAVVPQAVIREALLDNPDEDDEDEELSGPRRLLPMNRWFLLTFALLPFGLLSLLAVLR